MPKPSTSESGAQRSDQEEPELAIRVVHGNPDEQELAAVITALAAVRRPASEPAEPAGLSAWGAYWYRLGQRPGPGPAGWRASALPR